MSAMNTANEVCCNQRDQIKVDFDLISQNEKRTLWVVLLTSFMMVVEIAAGFITGSMALLADGYHMASHAGALSIAYVVYRLARSKTLAARFTFGSGKLLPLGGYTSAVGLGIISIWMIAESLHRFFNPIDIQFREAITIAGVGLVVNLLSAWVLGSGHSHHHDHEDEHGHDHVHDHNHRSAFVHVMADALTSVLAIVALSLGSFYQAHWLDPAMGILGAIVILKWAYGLCRNTARELLDVNASEFNLDTIRSALAADQIELKDFHAWKVGPSNYVSSMIVNTRKQMPDAYYRQVLGRSNVHLIVKEITV